MQKTLYEVLTPSIKLCILIIMALWKTMCIFEPIGCIGLRNG